MLLINTALQTSLSLIWIPSTGRPFCWTCPSHSRPPTYLNLGSTAVQSMGKSSSASPSLPTKRSSTSSSPSNLFLLHAGPVPGGHHHVHILQYSKIPQSFQHIFYLFCLVVCFLFCFYRVKCCTLSTWGEIFKVNGIFRGLHVTDFYHRGISKFLSLKVLTWSNILEQAAQGGGGDVQEMCRCGTLGHSLVSTVMTG